MKERVLEMADTLESRGPDDRGAWVDAESGIALGFRRLSIIDLSCAGHQPMISHDGRYIVAFNGEIYGFAELRDELAAGGYPFRGGSDTEVILAACSRWGVERAIPRLRGMFAIALWDRHLQRLTLVRDRVGKKPMFYGRMGSTFLFGSELKALHRHPAFESRIDRVALTQYLRFSYVPGPRSIFEGISKLPPGHLLHFHPAGTTELRCYWDTERVVEEGLAAPLSLSDVEAVDQLDRRLRSAVRDRMVSDVPLGAFLSGGIDSTAVVSLMQAQSSSPVRTFTIGSPDARYDEASAARAVAAHLGTDHTELYVTPEEALDVIPRLPTLFDEPFADSSQIPTFLVARLARQHVTVVLSGDGGDEVFSGYNRYLWANSIWTANARAPLWLRRAASASVQRIPPRVLDMVYSRAAWALPSRARVSLPGDKIHRVAELLPLRSRDEVYHRLVSSWAEPASVVIEGSEPRGPLSGRELPGVNGFTERMMLYDLLTYLPDDILVKVDRASMGVSLEARAPLLDHEVIEWAWRLPMHLKVRAGQGKWILRQVLNRYVPAALLDRPKKGFSIPVDAWLRGPLREWSASLLDPEVLRREGYFDAGAITRAWREHLAGHRNHQAALWAVLMFQAWQREWIG